MFCSFAKALNYIFLFISLQKEAAKKYFLVSLFILQETNKNNWGEKERKKCFQLLFLPPFIHKVCYNEHAKSNEAVTYLVAVNRYLFNELLLGFNAGYF